MNGGEPSKKDDKSMQETVEKLKEEKLKIKEKRKEEKEKLSKFMKEWNKKKEDLELEDLKVSVTLYFKNLHLTKLVYLLLLFGVKLHPYVLISSYTWTSYHIFYTNLNRNYIYILKKY